MLRNAIAARVAAITCGLLMLIVLSVPRTASAQGQWQAAAERRDLLDDKDHAPDHVHGDHSDHTVVAGTGEVSATAGGTSTLSVMRFIHQTIVIHAGETVDFDNMDPVTPHTITFGTEPADVFTPINVTPDADGALHATINSPSDNAHSGFIVAADQIGRLQTPLGVTRFRVTFPHAGTFRTSAPCTTTWV